MYSFLEAVVLLSLQYSVSESNKNHIWMTQRQYPSQIKKKNMTPHSNQQRLCEHFPITFLCRHMGGCAFAENCFWVGRLDIWKSHWNDLNCLEAVIESWWNLSGQEFFVHCASHSQMTSQIRFLGNDFSSKAYILQSAVLWHRTHCSFSFNLISIVDLLGTNHLFWFLTRVITCDCMILYNTWFNSSLLMII